MSGRSPWVVRLAAAGARRVGRLLCVSGGRGPRARAVPREARVRRRRGLRAVPRGGVPRVGRGQPRALDGRGEGRPPPPRGEGRRDGEPPAGRHDVPRERRPGDARDDGPRRQAHDVPALLRRGPPPHAHVRHRAPHGAAAGAALDARGGHGDVVRLHGADLRRARARARPGAGRRPGRRVVLDGTGPLVRRALRALPRQRTRAGVPGRGRHGPALDVARARRRLRGVPRALRRPRRHVEDPAARRAPRPRREAGRARPRRRALRLPLVPPRGRGRRRRGSRPGRTSSSSSTRRCSTTPSGSTPRAARWSSSTRGCRSSSRAAPRRGGSAVSTATRRTGARTARCSSSRRPTTASAPGATRSSRRSPPRTRTTSAAGPARGASRATCPRSPWSAGTAR